MSLLETGDEEGGAIDSPLASDETATPLGSA
jgi:hypothetical protein